MTLRTWFILVPCALVALILTLANLTPVTFSLDPFSETRPALAFGVPLFVVIFVSFFLGLLTGGMAAWVAQGRNRRDARKARREEKRVHKAQKKAAAAGLVAADERAPALPAAAQGAHAHHHGA